MLSQKYIYRAITLLCLFGVGTYAAQPILAQEEPPPVGARNMQAANLFRDEVQQALTKVKWRGERLSDDTVYALALTGASWQTAWGKRALFSMGWGELKKVPSLHKRNPRETEERVREVKSQFEGRDYRGTIRTATQNFSIDEIACQPDLKEAVGESYLALRQYDKAFAVFASPFDSTKMQGDSQERNLRYRQGAFQSALEAGERSEDYKRAAVVFGVSLLLDPDPNAPLLNTNIIGYLESLGIDVDRLCLGILQAPDRLPGLPAYVYSAMDVLVYRSKPRLLPYFMHLVQTGDTYLKARAILGLGVLANNGRTGDPRAWEKGLVSFPIRTFGLSTGERNLIEREVRSALQSGNFRLRTAGTMALALMGDDSSVPILQRLLKDRAYVITPLGKERKNVPHNIYYPVRMAAAAGLARFGVTANVIGGELSGRELDAAKRGGQNVSNERGGLDRDSIAQLFITPIDVATMIPIERPKER